MLIDKPDYEWLMIDASHCKVHPHATGAKDRNQHWCFLSAVNFLESIRCKDTRTRHDKTFFGVIL